MKYFYANSYFVTFKIKNKCFFKNMVNFLNLNHQVALKI